MVKTREILRLRQEMGLGLRQIARSLNISHSTVKDHLSRAELAGLCWPIPEDMTNAAIQELLFPSRSSNASRKEPDFALVHKELRRKGVTLQLLWEEYKHEHYRGGSGYSSSFSGGPRCENNHWSICSCNPQRDSGEILNIEIGAPIGAPNYFYKKRNPISREF